MMLARADNDQNTELRLSKANVRFLSIVVYADYSTSQIESIK